MQTQKIVPHKGMNLDIDEAYMPSDVARFIKEYLNHVNNKYDIRYLQKRKPYTNGRNIRYII